MEKKQDCKDILEGYVCFHEEEICFRYSGLISQMERLETLNIEDLEEESRLKHINTMLITLFCRLDKPSERQSRNTTAEVLLVSLAAHGVGSGQRPRMRKRTICLRLPYGNMLAIHLDGPYRGHLTYRGTTPLRFCHMDADKLAQFIAGVEFMTDDVIEATERILSCEKKHRDRFRREQAAYRVLKASVGQVLAAHRMDIISLALEEGSVRILVASPGIVETLYKAAFHQDRLPEFFQSPMSLLKRL